MKLFAHILILLSFSVAGHAAPARLKKTVPIAPKETNKKKPSGPVKILDPTALNQVTPSPTPAASEKRTVGDIVKDMAKTRAEGKASLSGAAAGGSSVPGTISSQISAGGSGGSGGSSGGGSGGSGSGGGGGGGTQSSTFDDNAAKGEGSGKPPSNGNGGGGQTPKIEAYDRWFPTCVFLDPSVPNGNSMVKGLVDMAAACQVNLVVFPFYIKNSPDSADAINNQARQSCNAIQGMGSQGVNRVASATVVPKPNLAAQMCGASNIDRDTCEDLTFNPGDTFLQRYKMTGRGGNVNATGSGIVARNNTQALATTVFRQITGLPYGSGAGLGLGNWNEGDASSAGLQKKDGLNDFGCAELRKSAYPNDGRWRYNPAQETYVVKGDAERMFDLGKPIFQNPQGPGGGGSADKTGGSGGGGSSSGEGGGSGGGSSGGSSGGGGSFPSGGGGLATSSGGGGHKRPLGGFGTGVSGSGGGSVAGAGGSGVKTISGGYGAGSGGEGGGDSSGTAGSSGSLAGGGSDLISVDGARGPGGAGGTGSTVGTLYDDKANKYETGFGGSQLAGAGGAGQPGGTLKNGSLDPNALKKADDAYGDAVAASKAKRPRTLSSDGPSSGTTFDPEFLKKIGKATRRENRYKGKSVSNGVTIMRRGTDDK